MMSDSGHGAASVSRGGSTRRTCIAQKNFGIISPQGDYWDGLRRQTNDARLGDTWMMVERCTNQSEKTGYDRCEG
jgi:hypothetical protein